MIGTTGGSEPSAGLMQNLSPAHHQISASTIGRYRAMAAPYRDGTWNHDVSQNIQALLAAIAGARPPQQAVKPCATNTGQLNAL